MKRLSQTFLALGVASVGLLSTALWANPQTNSKPKPPIQPKRAEAPAPLSAEDMEFFEKKIRPLLAANCFSCHAKAEGSGGLRADSLEGLLKGGRHGAALVPGKPEQSLLMEVVGYEEKIKMPPTGKLSSEQIADLTEWVKRGAPWTGASKKVVANAGFEMKSRLQHWSWRPVRPQAIPVVKNQAWARTPIDRFILAKLEAKKLTPAPPADKRTLLRRVTFDLIGLPPTLDELRNFLQDNSPNAYEKVVDRLLASPHYGERWARHWLDLVRYAETDGHEFDFEKPNAYQYRDYVIRAFNADVPYPQFVQEHIAGDLLPQPRRNPHTGVNESVIATGFWWLGEGKHSPVDILGDEAERVDNQIDVFSKTFLGLSLGCARCHDHKFDAITTKDYYALSGYLKSSRFHLAEVTPPKPRAEKAQALAQAATALLPGLSAAASREGRQFLESIRAVQQADSGGGRLVAHATAPNLRAAQEAWKKTLATAAANPNDPLYAWANLASAPPAEFQAAKERVAKTLQARLAQANEAQQSDILFEDFTQGYANWFRTGEAFAGNPVASSPVLAEENGVLRQTGLFHGGVADSGRISDALQGTLRSRTFLIAKPYLLLRMAGKGTQARLVIDGFQRIRFPIYGGLELQVNKPEMTWHSMEVGKWVGHPAYLEFLDYGGGRIAVDRLLFSDRNSAIDAPNARVLALLNDPAVTNRDRLAEGYQRLLSEAWSAFERAGDAPLDPAQAQLADWLLRHRNAAPSTDSALASLVQTYRQREAELPPSLRVMAADDGTPWNDRVHLRGSYKTLGDTVPRRNLEAFGGVKQPAPATASGRLELAQQVASPANPLTNRVIVNRLWHHHFGAGIVRTPDDFGFMGERPTHPELLDWLAAEFARQGGSLKKMHRLIVASSVYRMASVGSPKAAEADPTNRLLHRMPLRRLEAEAIRDAVLAVSGRLNRTLYGPSVLPYLTPFMSGRGRPDKSGPLDGDGRRSLYIGVRRNFLTPLFTAFDYPVPFTTIGRRSVSNVPAQALAMMNNPFVIEQANRWAERLLSAPNRTPQERVQEMYRTAYGREATAPEVASALEFVQGQRATGSDERRAWADLCHVLFNVKEFIFVR